VVPRILARETNERSLEFSVVSRKGLFQHNRSNPDFLGAARPLPPSADSGPVKAAQFCLGRRVASPVAATTEFLAPDTKLIELLKGQPPEQGRVAR